MTSAQTDVRIVPPINVFPLLSFLLNTALSLLFFYPSKPAFVLLQSLHSADVSYHTTVFNYFFI